MVPISTRENLAEHLDLVMWGPFLIFFIIDLTFIYIVNV